MKRAVFLDRDGVLIEDRDLVQTEADCVVLRGVPSALASLHRAGFVLVVVSNQPVVARGLLSEGDVIRLHSVLEKRLVPESDIPLHWYFCPHHPAADVAAYRMQCTCRKPRSGLLTQAAHTHGLTLQSSFLIGDRMTDIEAGARVGCRTVQVLTGRHTDRRIQTPEPPNPAVQPDFIARGLPEAVEWILAQQL